MWACCALTNGDVHLVPGTGPAFLYLTPGGFTTVMAPASELDVELESLGTARATTLPLPYQIAGLSVRVEKTLERDVWLDAPMVQVRRFSLCDLTGSGAVLEADCPEMVEIVFQVPYEMMSSRSLQNVLPGRRIRLLHNGVAVSTRPYMVRLGASELNRSELMWPGLLAHPMATHPDGTVISSVNPARPGQEIILYATGTGRPSSTEEILSGTGGEAQPPLRSDDFHLSVILDYSLTGVEGAEIQPSEPLKAYFVRGAVGLVAVHARVPALPKDPLTLCGTPQPRGRVASNLIVSLQMEDGAAGAVRTGICVSNSPAPPRFRGKFEPAGYPISHSVRPLNP